MTTNGVGSGALRQAVCVISPIRSSRSATAGAVEGEGEMAFTFAGIPGWQRAGGDCSGALQEIPLILVWQRRPGAEKGSDPSAELSSEVCRSHRNQPERKVLWELRDHSQEACL